MGMYTEFYFRANIKEGEFADWLDQQINHEGGFEKPFDPDPFWPHYDHWYMPFIGGGAVYQESRTPIFRLKTTGAGEPYHHQLVLASSYKGGNSTADDFVKWIGPYLDMHTGDFLGYSLYEDSCDGADLYREHPHFYYHQRDLVMG
jgi:hypothetical protein